MADVFLALTLAVLSAPAGGKTLLALRGAGGAAGQGQQAPGAPGERPALAWREDDGRWSVFAGTATETGSDAKGAVGRLAARGQGRALVVARRGEPFAAFLEFPAAAAGRLEVAAVRQEDQ